MYIPQLVCFCSGSGKFIPVPNNQSNHSAPLLGGHGVDHMSGEPMNLSTSGSSMVMSPVTPPTEDEEEKTLHIDTGSPIAPPPAPRLVVNVSPKTQTENAIKPQAVVNPMASDTSPVSSGSNQNGVVAGGEVAASVSGSTGPTATAIPASARLQSVLTSQLSTGTPPPAIATLPVSGQPTPASIAASIKLEPNNLSHLTSISIEQVAKGNIKPLSAKRLSACVCLHLTATTVSV